MENPAQITNFIIRSLFLALLGFWCFGLLQPFFGILLWGAILATISYPIFKWLKNLLGGRKQLAAILLTLLSIALIIGPVSYLSTLLVDNAQEFAKQLSSGNWKVPPPPETIDSWPVVGESLTRLWQSASTNLKEVLRRFSPQIQDLGGKLLLIAAGTGLTLLKFLGSIVIAGVLLINTESINQWLTRLVTKITPSKGQAFLQLSIATVRGVTRGIIGVSLVQSLMIGIGLAVAQIPWAGLLTLLCLVLTVMQIGPGLVVIPTIIGAWLSMNPLSATLYTAWMIPALLIDNFLKPLLMGRGLPVPIWIVFLGVIGGTLTNGILGLFVGPVVLSLGYELLKNWLNDSPSTNLEK